MAEIKHVRLYPAGVAGLGLGSSWSCIGGKAAEEAWKELREGKENRYQGNTNGEGGAELLPGETTGIQAETITGPAAAFKVDAYVLKGGETLLAVKAVARINEAIVKAVKISIGGATSEGQTFGEVEALVETLNGWASISQTAEAVKKLSEHPGLLAKFLEGGACDLGMAKAKKVKGFTLYIDLEIEVAGGPTPIPLNAAASTSAGQAAASASTAVVQQPATSEAAATMATTAKTQVLTVAATSGSASSSSVTATAIVTPGAASSSSAATAAFTAAANLLLVAAASSNAAAALTARTELPVAAGTGASQAAVNVTARTQLPLATSTSTSEAAATVAILHPTSVGYLTFTEHTAGKLTAVARTAGTLTLKHETQGVLTARSN